MNVIYKNPLKTVTFYNKMVINDLHSITLLFYIYYAVINFC